MNNVSYMMDYTPGIKMYCPELGERKPRTTMEATLAYYGKHYFVDTPEILKGRGIEYRMTYKADELTIDGQYKIGWRSYCVTMLAFEKLKAKYAICMKSRLD